MYYGWAQYMPNSYNKYLGGRFWNKIRVLLCHVIFKECGNIATVNRKAFFGNGKNVVIGDNSGLGENCQIPNDIKIGNNVMIGPNLTIYSVNHRYERVDIPMCEQGVSEFKRTVIGDDCWIGGHVIFTPGHHLGDGCIVGAGSVVTKSFDSYSIVGGNPAQLIRFRIPK